ncbi:hypothetical protein [Herbaspirillum sp. CF444]|uniref:hypothetical protein n=1 Tax=Herbaspirillum sp. CF444 TaxID=1144319 RepID=UPI0012FBC3AA|nr:hypothetical protein [Herbaspirillum sp. CF444]
MDADDDLKRFSLGSNGPPLLGAFDADLSGTSGRAFTCYVQDKAFPTLPSKPVLVSFALFFSAGKHFSDDGTFPAMSVDGKTGWARTLDVTTVADDDTVRDRPVMVYLRDVSSNAAPVQTRMTVSIMDAVAPDHWLEFGNLHSVVTGIVFRPNSSQITWQNRYFPDAAKVIVQTIPPSTQDVVVHLAGPGSGADPSDYSARFVQGNPQTATFTAGETLPAIQAGKEIGEVSLQPSSGTVFGASMVWHVLPVPDRMTIPEDTKKQSFHKQRFSEQFVTINHALTGHRILGSSDPAQVVPVADWYVKWTFVDSNGATFGDHLDSFLVQVTDGQGNATLQAKQLAVPEGCKGFTIKVFWNEEPDGTGSWIEISKNACDIEVGIGN